MCRCTTLNSDHSATLGLKEVQLSTSTTFQNMATSCHGKIIQLCCWGQGWSVIMMIMVMGRLHAFSAFSISYFRNLTAKLAGLTNPAWLWDFLELIRKGTEGGLGYCSYSGQLRKGCLLNFDNSRPGCFQIFIFNNFKWNPWSATFYW